MFTNPNDLDFINQPTAIQKIIWLRKRTGFSLLAAKTLFDGLKQLENPFQPVHPSTRDRASELLSNQGRTENDRMNDVLTAFSKWQNDPEMAARDLLELVRNAVR